jgi:hypothetical protein
MRHILPVMAFAKLSSAVVTVYQRVLIVRLGGWWNHTSVIAVDGIGRN